MNSPNTIKSLQEIERLRRALEFYALGQPTCCDEDGLPPKQGCKHQTCEFPKCAELVFPKWDDGRTARDALKE